MSTHVARSCTILLIAAFAICQTASAQFNRTAVSITGSDANSCTAVSPCRSFDRAIAQTNSGGEVIALDSGGYGPFTVNKAVSVQAAPGVYAGITMTSVGDGITVAAGPSDAVELRGLTVRSISTSGGYAGVYYLAGKSLHIYDMVIGGFDGHGIFSDHGGDALLFVRDTVIRGTVIGIRFFSGGGIMKASVANTSVENAAADAFVAHDNARVTINNSVASGSNTGFRVAGNSAITEMNIERSIASNNTSGLIANGAVVSVMRVSGTMITNNQFGISVVQPNSVVSWGNNRRAGNTTPGAFTGTIPLD